MKNILILFFTVILLVGCGSTSKVAEFVSTTQAPCRDDKKLNDSNEFTTETVDNIKATVNGDFLTLTYDARVYCNSILATDFSVNGSTINLRLKNNESQKVDCVCIMTVTTVIKNLGKGNYTVNISNYNGALLLGQTSISVN